MPKPKNTPTSVATLNKNQKLVFEAMSTDHFSTADKLAARTALSVGQVRNALRELWWADLILADTRPRFGFTPYRIRTELAEHRKARPR